MSINKNFIVRNGLEVGTNFIIADDEYKKVGVGTTPTQFAFEIYGGLGTVDLNVSGVSTLTDLNVTGSSNFISLLPESVNASGVITASQFVVTSGIGINTNTISGPSEIVIDPSTVGDNTGALRIKGDLYVDGAYVNLQAQDFSVVDKLIGISSNATPSDSGSADQSGILVYGTTDKTFLYDYGSNSWLSDQNLNLKIGKTYKINAIDVLTSTSLGAGVTISQLQSVGTLQNLSVLGTINAGGFVGVLTGTSTGLSGKPDIVVGLVSATNLLVGSSGTTIYSVIDTNGANIVGILTASYFNGDGSQLINTPISSRWALTSVGINTLYNVGVGTTNSTSKLTVSGDVKATGVVTASKYFGDGSSLTGIVGSGSGVVVKDDDATVGTAGTINFGNNLFVSPISAGLVTITAAGSPWISNSTGIHTLSNVAIGTTSASAARFTVVSENVSNFTSFAGDIADFITNYDASSQIVVLNQSPGINASGDVVITSNVGTDTSYYLNLGINNSNYSQTGWSINGPSDAYLYSSDTALSIGASTYVNFFVGGTDITHEVMRIDSNLNVGIGSTIPTHKFQVGSQGEVFFVDHDGSVGIGTTLAQSDVHIFAPQVSITGGIISIGSTILQSDMRIGWGVGSYFNSNVVLGRNSNSRTTTGNGNVSVGNSSLYFNVTGDGNVAIGNSALKGLVTGTGNVAIGNKALSDTQLTGSSNIAIGYQAGRSLALNASGNVIIGSLDPTVSVPPSYVLAPPIVDGNEQLVVGSYNGVWLYGNNQYNIGLGVTNPSTKLEVSGTVKATNFIGDGSGLIGVNATGVGLQINNENNLVGVATIINFGDNVDVSPISLGIVTVSSPSQHWKATSAGINTTVNVGIATTNPTSALFVNGDARITSGLKVVGLSTITTIGGNVAELDIIGDYTDAKLLIQRDEFVDKAEIHFSSAEYGGTEFIVGTSGDRRLQLMDETRSSLVSFDRSGNANFVGVITAVKYVGDGSGLSGVVGQGSGINLKRFGSSIGIAGTIDISSNLIVSDITAGIATISGVNGLKSRVVVSGSTTSITNNGIGTCNISGFKSYTLMKVGLSTAGWLRIYTDSTSRANDVSRSIGIDPAPGSGVIAEVVTTGISTTQIITPFVMGGNLDNPESTTIYATITNLSGVTTSITANLTILQIEV